MFYRHELEKVTKDFTPEMFLGDITNDFTGTLNSLKYHAEDYAPAEINIDGFVFKSMGSVFTTFEKNKNIIQLHYQSVEKLWDEYPVIQIGIRVWRTPKGKVKAEIIRDGFTNKTRFW